MVQKKGLGRGLGALIKDGSKPLNNNIDAEGNRIIQASVSSIKRSSVQPRHVFEKDALDELTASIKEHGVLQPLVVRSLENSNDFELIAGERRLRASIQANLKTVPIIVIKAGDNKALEIALVENLQRENLNPIEEAEGYQLLAKRFELTQEAIADRVGKSRPAVANAMRLLALPAEIKDFLSTDQLSVGHAKLLSSMAIEKEQILFARQAVREHLSVRNLEKIIKKRIKAARKPRAVKNDIPADHLGYLSDKLHTHFGTSIKITPCQTFANGKKGKGSIEVDFYSNDDLDRILDIMNIPTD